MSFIVAGPDALAAAASDIAGIGSTINAANTAAASPTAELMAPAADAVSAQVAEVFSSHAQIYRQLSTQMSAFHDQFVGALQATANAYAATEANSAQSLAASIGAPVAKLLGQPLIGQGSGTAAAGALTNALGALRLPATGGANIVKAASALLAPTGGIAAAAANAAGILPAGIGDAIEAFYLTVEPYVEYGFNLASYVAGFVPYAGLLAPQINFFYYLFEPIVQAGLFNTIDWLEGSISFAQGLSNFWAVTTASVNQFITTEINWVFSFLPPLPPLPPL
jgi:PE family